MNKFIQILAAAFAYIFGSIGIVFVLLMLVPIIGGITGWIFSWVFDDSFKALLSMLRVNATGFEVGAAIGFVAAMFRASPSSSSSSTKK